MSCELENHGAERDLTAENPGGALSITGFAVSNGQISVTVQLVRQSPLGYINGVLYLYCADDLAVGFGRSPIANEVIDFGDGDSTFDFDSATVPASGSVTQTVTATFDTSLGSEKFIKAAIEFVQSEDSGEDPGGVRNVANVEMLPIANYQFQLGIGNIGTGNTFTLATLKMRPNFCYNGAVKRNTSMKKSLFRSTVAVMIAIAGTGTTAAGANLAPVAVDDQFYVNRSDYFLRNVVARTGPVAATLNCVGGADTPAILVNGLYTGPNISKVACGITSGLDDAKTVVSSQFFGEIFHSVVNGSETPVSLADVENSGPASGVVKIDATDYLTLLGGGTYSNHNMAWYANPANGRMLLVEGNVSLAPSENALTVGFACPAIIHGNLTVDAGSNLVSTAQISSFLYVTGDAQVENLSVASDGAFAVAGNLSVTGTVSSTSMGVTATFTIGGKLLADGETPLEYACSLAELLQRHSRQGQDYDPDNPDSHLTVDVRSMIQISAAYRMTLYYYNGTETVAIGTVGAAPMSGTAVSLNAGYHFNATGQVVVDGNGVVISDDDLSFGVRPVGTAFSVSPQFSYRIWDNDAAENMQSDAATVTIVVAADTILGGGGDDVIAAVGDGSGDVIRADVSGEGEIIIPGDGDGDEEPGDGDEENEDIYVAFSAKPGSDIVDGGGGNDVLFGDSGIVGLEMRVAVETGVSEDAVTDADILRYLFEHPDVVAGWHGADNSQTDPDTGESLDRADVLIGNDGGDIVFAQGGDDILFGDASLDAVAGWLELSGGYLTSVNMAVKIGAMYVAQLKSDLANLEGSHDGDDLLFGGDGDDSIFGLGGDDELHGGSGSDMLFGGGGADVLHGGAGSDYLDGGAGADMIDGGAGSDIIRYDAADTIDGGDDIDILIGNSGDGSFANLTNVSNVEIFLKVGSGDFDALNLTDISKLEAVAGLYVDDNGEVRLEDEEGCPDENKWQLVGRENGITTVTCAKNDFALTLETTMGYEDGKLVILPPPDPDPDPDPDPVPDLAPVPYLDPVANTINNCETYTLYAGQTALDSGWYVVTNAVTNDARIVVSGDVNLILADGAELVAKKGVNVALANNTTNSLTVWAQSDGEGMGSLTATHMDVSQYQSAIGGDAGQQGGTVVINGGRVSATGLGAGIGGGDGGSGATGDGVGVSDFTNFQLNGDSWRISDVELRLSLALKTNGGTAFWRKRVNVTRPWRAFFTYKTVLSSVPADGFAFFLHNDERGLSAQGDMGGYLCANEITPSVGTAYNIYGDDSAGWIKDGATTNMTTALGGIAIQNGMDVCVTYDGEGRIVQHLFSNGSYVAFTNDVNLAEALGDTTAWIGFSGATGASVCEQRITNFRFWQADAKGSAPDISASDDASKWRLNGSAVYESFNNAPAFRITDMSNNTSGLVTRLERVYVGGPFKVHGTYHVTGNSANDGNMADGIALFFHSQSPAAIGGKGGDRGVLGNSALPSATGWMINIYPRTPNITPLKNCVQGSSFTALNGINPKTTVPVDFTLSYVPGRLSFTLEQDGKTATTSQNVDLAQTFGDKFAYFSISGGTGTRNAQQYIYNLSMESVNEGGGTVVVNGGTVTATGNNYGIEAGDGSVTINGGTVAATGADGIYARCGITLGWTKPADSITASSFSSDNGVCVKVGQTFADDRQNRYEGTLDADALVAVRNKTLRPYIETPSFTDPEGQDIGDPAIVNWLSANNFTQGDINALGSDATATEKLYECYLLNCDLTAANPGGALRITGFAVSTNEVSVTVQLVRQSPMGFINGVLYLYGAGDLAVGFGRSPIANEIIDFGEGDSTFNVDPTTVPASGSVTQTVTATFDTSLVSAKFIRAAIEFVRSEDSEGEE